MTSEPNERRDLSAAAGRSKAHAAVRSDLHRLERLFADQDWPDRRSFARVRRRARERALEALECGRPETDATEMDAMRTALLIAAAELFGGLRIELASAPDDAARLAEQVEEVIGLSRIGIAREVLRAPELLTLLPAVAVEAQLAMLTVFAPLRSASLWTLDNSEQVSCMRHVGQGGPSRGARQLARRLLAGESAEPSPRGLLLGLPVGRWDQPLAALVGSARPGMRDNCHSFLAEAVPMLCSVLERDALLAGNAASERALL
jgi:hypothetical protein